MIISPFMNLLFARHIFSFSGFLYLCVDYVNDFDQPVVFQCPNGGVMDGVHSYHYNGAEDRRFRFYCCEKPGYVQKQSFTFHLYQVSQPTVWLAGQLLVEQ